ncbi:MAG: DNA (cytosine-5-)-methyltransferase, partial [Atopobiaceae bacterium]|nr:DNA (cytosine-5-)-methyltransferase [Atopobiaceae bacterium]
MLEINAYRSERRTRYHKEEGSAYRGVERNAYPTKKKVLDIYRCYEERFGEGSCVNEDIAVVLDRYEEGELDVPDVDMVVGGFPCQDYSVARPLSQAGGIEGEKGVLWWSIYRFLKLKCPKYCLFENVDRLLKSPARQRGRDFAIILSCLDSLGYSAEWRVVNSAEYGFPQR